MFVVIVSSCIKKSKKKTRSIVDQYATRIAENTWQTSITMSGVQQLHQELKDSATRHTAVTCFVNSGYKKLNKLWEVGSNKRKYNNQYSTFTTADTLSYRSSLPRYIRIISLLAKTSGYAHDFGKASKKFQNKLIDAKVESKDSIRHEWISLRVLQNLRKGKSWEDAWKEPINVTFNGFMQTGLKNIIDVLDFCVVTHHGLFCKKEKDKNINENENNFHIRQENFDEKDYLLAGNISNKLLDNVKSGENRLKKIYKENELLELEYFAWITRAMLIMADHVVSKSFIEYKPQKEKCDYPILANTRIDKDTHKRVPNQSLDFHLLNVGNLAAKYAFNFFMDKNYPSLSEDTINKINLKTKDNRFIWQDIGVEYLNVNINKNILIFNIANTGSGKTLANIKLANAVSNPESFRVSICLNLRSLTLQTGREYKKVLGLNDDELSVIIGDKITQALFKFDEDENDVEPEIEIDESYNPQYQELPEWLEDFCSESKNRKNIISSPMLVSTVDYLINAAIPSKQGHHVAALIRISSADLILDEVDGYEPKQLAIICKLIELSSFFGRNVICSTATLSKHVADIIIVAFNRGKEARKLVIDNNHTSQFSIIDNVINPSIIDFDDNSTVLKHYVEQINLKNYSTLSDYNKLARLARVLNLTKDDWLNSILDSINFHHKNQQFMYKNCKISFGLIRVANINHGMVVSKFLAEKIDNSRVCFYHANDFRLARFNKEKALDDLLTRKDINKEYTLIDDIIKGKDEVLFIVVATSVEEIGRDHDFDYSVIEPSSCSSIIQTAGRVNRHRKEKQELPNISILQFNYKSLTQNPNQKITFTRPGLEVQLISSTTHPIKDIEKILPWDDNGILEITSKLRFNSIFAEYDDNGIVDETKKIKNIMFNTNKSIPSLLKNKVYYDYRFRDSKNSITIDLRYDNKDIYYFTEYKQAPRDNTNLVTVESKIDNDWLSLSHLELNKLCRTVWIDYIVGKSIDIDKPYDNSNIYHNWSFGWYVK